MNSNRLQIVTVILAMAEVLICCLLMPVVMSQIAEYGLSGNLREQEVASANVGDVASDFMNTSRVELSLNQKIEIVNSFDNAITSISLDKGEEFSPNQICSIGAGEMEKIVNYFTREHAVFRHFNIDEILESVRAFGIYLEEQSHEYNSDEVGYADVETVDDVDIKVDSIFMTDTYEINIGAMMYVNASEPEQTFIAWQISYYDIAEDATLFLFVDDETGKLLSFKGTFHVSEEADGEEGVFSLYDNLYEITSMLEEYYEMEVSTEGDWNE